MSVWVMTMTMTMTTRTTYIVVIEMETVYMGGEFTGIRMLRVEGVWGACVWRIVGDCLLFVGIGMGSRPVGGFLWVCGLLGGCGDQFGVEVEQTMV